jgi:hypothetical protein
MAVRDKSFCARSERRSLASRMCSRPRVGIRRAAEGHVENMRSRSSGQQGSRGEHAAVFLGSSNAPIFTGGLGRSGEHIGRAHDTGLQGDSS